MSMPFTDTPDGQTHYQNDGCGIVEHNHMVWKYPMTGQDGFYLLSESDLNNLAEERERRGREQGLREARDLVEDTLHHCDRFVPEKASQRCWDTCRFILDKLDSLLSQHEGK